MEFELRLLAKFHPFPTAPLPPSPYGRNLIAVSSQLGFAVICGADNRLISVKTSVLHDLHSGNSSRPVSEFPHRKLDFFDGNAEIFSLAFNSDGRVLVVGANTANGPFVYFFDALTHAPDNEPQPFPLNSFRVGASGNDKLTVLDWNPVEPDSIAIGTTVGFAVLKFALQNPATVGMVGNKQFNAAVTCISWSPKGKQITIGTSAGHIYQVKPDCSVVRNVPPPSTVPDLPAGVVPACVGLLWVSTPEWIVIFAAGNKLASLLLTVKKDQPPNWRPLTNQFFDVAAGVPTRSVQFLSLLDAGFATAVASCLSNAAYYAHSPNGWVSAELADEYMITMPMSKDFKDTLPVGARLDFSSVKPLVVEKDGTSVPPQPIVYLLSSNSELVLYHMTNRSRDAKPLTQAPTAYDVRQSFNGTAPPGWQPRPAPAVATSAPVAPVFGAAATATPTFSFAAASTMSSTPSIQRPTPVSAFTPAPVTSSTPVTLNGKETTVPSPVLDPAAADAAWKKTEEENQRKVQEVARQKAADEKRARERAEEEEKRIRVQEEATFKAAVDSAVARLNEYGRTLDELKTVKKKAESGFLRAMDYDPTFNKMVKCNDYIRVIIASIQDELDSRTTVVNVTQSLAKDCEKLMNADVDKLPVSKFCTELKEKVDGLKDEQLKTFDRVESVLRKLETVKERIDSGIVKPLLPKALNEKQCAVVAEKSEYVMKMSQKLQPRVAELTQALQRLRFERRFIELERTYKAEQSLHRSFQTDLNLSEPAVDAAFLSFRLDLSPSKSRGEKPKSAAGLQRVRGTLTEHAKKPARLVQPTTVKAIEEVVKQQTPTSKEAREAAWLTPEVLEARKKLFISISCDQAAVRPQVHATPPRPVVDVGDILKRLPKSPPRTPVVQSTPAPPSFSFQTPKTVEQPKTVERPVEPQASQSAPKISEALPEPAKTATVATPEVKPDTAATTAPVAPAPAPVAVPSPKAAEPAPEPPKPIELSKPEQAAAAATTVTAPAPAAAANASVAQPSPPKAETATSAPTAPVGTGSSPFGSFKPPADNSKTTPPASSPFGAAPKPATSGNIKFSFGKPSTPAPAQPTAAATGNIQFSFKPQSPLQQPASPSPFGSFGTQKPTTPSIFGGGATTGGSSFGGGTTTAATPGFGSPSTFAGTTGQAAAATSPFGSFGSNQQPAQAPSTDVGMEEDAEPAKLNFGGFGLGSAASSAPTGQNANPFGSFGAAKPAATDNSQSTNSWIFGNKPAQPGTSVFGGGAAATGSTSAFGGNAFASAAKPSPFASASSFGGGSGSGTSTFGGGVASSGSSTFGGGATFGASPFSSVNKPSPFGGGAAASTGTTSMFGGNAFQTTASPFAKQATQPGAATTSTFGGGAVFGSNTKNTAFTSWRN